MLPLTVSPSKSPLKSLRRMSPLTDLICTSPLTVCASMSPESVPMSSRFATSSTLMSPLCERASTSPCVPEMEMSPDCARATIRTPVGTLTSKRESPLRPSPFDSWTVTRELLASKRTPPLSLVA